MNLFRLSFLYLKRHLFTTVVTILSLGIAIAAVTVLMKLEVLSHSRFDTLANQGNAIVGAKSGGIDILLGALNFEGDIPNYVPQNLYETLKAKKEISFEDQTKFKDGFSITHITPILVFGKYKGFTLVGTDESLLNLTPSENAPQLDKGSFPQNPGEVLVGASFPSAEAVEVGSNIYVHANIHGSTVSSSAFPLKVVGILKPTGKAWDQGLYTNLATAQTAIAVTPGYSSIWGPKVLSYFLLNIEIGGEDSFASLINQRTVAQIAFIEKEKSRLQDLTGSNQSLQLLIVGILLALSTLTVLAVFFTRIEARTMELAVLRALGYSRRDLTRLLFIEGIWIGAISIALAAIVELILSPFILKTVGSTLPLVTSTNFPPWMIAVTGACALVAIILASLPPVWKLYRQDIHTTLRNI
ncbi:MAG: ABC transporter permease [Bdellovibrio sp.]|nr:ABC transporter permease [Bdellovibrio sp.]